MARVGLLLLLLILSVFSFSGATAEKKTNVRDPSQGRLIEADGIIPRGAKAQAQAGGQKRKNKKSTKRSRKGEKRRQGKKEGKRTKNGKKKHKGDGKSKTKKKKRPKKKTNSRQSCSSNEASLTCMKNAVEGMMFEKNQIANYLKQAKRLENHGTISTNKVGKRDNFDDAKKHLLWAIGGNLSDPKCGPNTTSEKTAGVDYDSEKTEALKSYADLANCSVAIEAACNTTKLDGYNATAYAENITICRSMMSDAIANSKKCQGLTTSTSDQCACWANQTVLMNKIKAFDCRAKSTQKEVTAQKNACIKVFGNCKTKEDASIAHVLYCMNDHSMGFINQSSESLALAAVSATRIEARVDLLSLT